MTNPPTLDAAPWNLPETIYYLCTLNFRQFPDDDCTLNEALANYERAEGHSLFRDLREALIELALAIEERRVSAYADDTVGSKVSRDIRSICNDPFRLHPFDRDDLLEGVDQTYVPAHIERIATALRINAQQKIDEFDQQMEQVRWLALHQAVRLILRSQTDGQLLNAFPWCEDWKGKDHPTWLIMFAGKQGPELFETAVLRWSSITKNLTVALQEGELIAVSNGMQLSPSAWQDQLIGWWESNTMPEPILVEQASGIARLNHHSIAPHRRNANILIDRKALERIITAGRFKEVAPPPLCNPKRYVAEAELRRFAERLHRENKWTPVKEIDFEKAVAETFGLGSTTRRQRRQALAEVGRRGRGRPTEH